MYVNPAQAVWPISVATKCNSGIVISDARSRMEKAGNLLNSAEKAVVSFKNPAIEHIRVASATTKGYSCI
jgi:hypothetical protein